MKAMQLSVRRNPRVVSQRLAGEQGAVLLHLDTSAYHSLNEVGSLIWDLITDPVGIDQLRVRVAAEFADAPGSLGTDVSAFLDDLAARGLIEFEPVPQSGA